MGLGCSKRSEPSKKEQNKFMAILKARPREFKKLLKSTLKYYINNSNQFEQFANDNFINYGDSLKYIYSIEKKNNKYEFNENKYNNVKDVNDNNYIVGCIQTGSTITIKSNPIQPIPTQPVHIPQHQAGYPPRQFDSPLQQTGYLQQQTGYPPRQTGYLQQQTEYQSRQTGYLQQQSLSKNLNVPQLGVQQYGLSPPPYQGPSTFKKTN